MDEKEEMKVQKSRLNSTGFSRTIQANSTNKNILFYRKSFLRNNKISCYYHKKGNNSNITPNNKYNYISGHKKPQKSLNYTNEDANLSTKVKTNYSNSKSKCDDLTPEKYIINNKTISSFTLKSNDKDKNISPNALNNNNVKKPSIINCYLDRKRANKYLNNPNKINNITITNDDLKKNIKYENENNINKKKKFNFKHKKIKLLRNNHKKDIKANFKTDNNQESFNILNHNIVQNIQNSLNKYNNYNNTNTIIINNTIKRNNSNFLQLNKPKKTELTLNNNIFDLNNINKIGTSKRNLVKGKIIKFKYNGTEFFFEPVHNKTESYFYKRNTNYSKSEIKAANSIKKWWKHINLINILTIKIRIKNGTNLIDKVQLKRIFKYIKYKTIYLKKIIYIQKQWKKFLYLKKNKSNIYIKNDPYFCDNSYRKNNGNLLMNTFEYINSLEDNFIDDRKNKIYYKCNNLKKKTNLINTNFFFANISNKNLISPKNHFENNNAIRKVAKNTCCYSKIYSKNILDKIIFIQRKIKKYIRYKYYSFIKNIYKEIYTNKLKAYEKEINNKLKEQKNKNLENMGVTKYLFNIISQKNNCQKQFSIIKNENLNYKGIISKYQNKNYILSINKTSKILYRPITVKKHNEFKISNNQNISLISKKNITETKIEKIKETNFSIINHNKNNKNIIITNKPIQNNHSFCQKILISNKYIKSFIIFQKLFRKRKVNKNELKLSKINRKNDCYITKLYKSNVSRLSNIYLVQNKVKKYFGKEKNIISKPINKNIFITKLIKRNFITNPFNQIKRNNSFKTIIQSDNNKNQIYFNNIDEFLHDKEGEKINDVTKYNTINNSHRKFSRERNSTLTNDIDEYKNENPIKIKNAEIHKSNINTNFENITNLKEMKNKYTPNNKYVNIESLPSINSLKTNTENNDIFGFETNKINNNYKINNNINNISIQTLGSNLSKNKFRENIKYIKRMTTEGNNYKNEPIEYGNKSYIYTYNDIVKFSFNNEIGDPFDNSISRINTINYFNFVKFINERITKLFIHKIKEIRNDKCLYMFIQILIQRINKYINTFVFNTIFNRHNKDDYYKIIKKHLNIYNIISKEPKNKNKFKKNELIILLKENIFNSYFGGKFLFLYPEQEKNFNEKDIFISNDKDLINYFLLYFKYEYKPIDNSYLNMIQFRLIKEPLYNMNIFSITKYMETLYNNIMHDNICKTCFCKKGESCSIKCNCHIKEQNSINLINKIKNRITHNKSFNEPTKDNNSFIDEKNKQNERNIRIIIKKIKRTGDDNKKSRYNNNDEQSSDSKASNSIDLDIFQKMNAGVQSIINKVKINKAYRDFNNSKKKKIDRTTTEIVGVTKKKKEYNEGLYNVNNHFTTPDKKSCSFLIEKKLLNG